MANNDFVKHLDKILHEKVDQFLSETDVTSQETPLKKPDQIKQEFKERFFDFVYSMSQSLTRAQEHIQEDLKFVATPEECSQAEAEFQKVGTTFFAYIANFEQSQMGKEAENFHFDVKATETFQKIFGFSDQSMLLFYKLTTYYAEKKEFGKSKDLLHLLLSLNPRISSYWVAMGVCCQREQKFDEALSYFKNGALINEKNPSPNLYAAACCLEMQDKSQAKEMLKQAEWTLDNLEADEQKRWQPWVNSLRVKILK